MVNDLANFDVKKTACLPGDFWQSNNPFQAYGDFKRKLLILSIQIRCGTIGQRNGVHATVNVRVIRRL